ncbi:MAG: ACP S-malonyltransferase [Bacteroidales bacterium]|nr:ACP S-malonyltransferase [Bacteroidales bacterium]
MKNKTAFIFPAFITEFTRNEIEFLDKNFIDFNDYLHKASVALNINLPEFSYNSDVYRDDELNSQLLTYLFSCAFSDLLQTKGIVPELIAGYSMGIYASLYAAKSITIENGAKLIFNAYNLVKNLTRTRIYGMGAIIGLSTEDVGNLIKDSAPDLEIININNKHSLVIAGKKNDVLLVLKKAKDEGAFSTTELTVDTPYHSKYLLKYSEPFKKYINTIPIKNTEIPVISTYDQREFTKSSEIKSELVLNLTCKINWYKTMQKLIHEKVNVFYECGAGKDLKKIARFIQGDYKINSIYKL